MPDEPTVAEMAVIVRAYRNKLEAVKVVLARGQWYSTVREVLEDLDKALKKETP